MSLSLDLQIVGRFLAASNMVISITFEDEVVLCLVFTTNPAFQAGRT
jgi:hypothetical protein